MELVKIIWHWKFRNISQHEKLILVKRHFAAHDAIYFFKTLLHLEFFCAIQQLEQNKIPTQTWKLCCPKSDRRNYFWLNKLQFIHIKSVILNVIFWFSPPFFVAVQISLPLDYLDLRYYTRVFETMSASSILKKNSGYSERLWTNFWIHEISYIFLEFLKFLI